jgi:hemerythrin-like domain-containing protein
MDQTPYAFSVRQCAKRTTLHDREGDEMSAHDVVVKIIKQEHSSLSQVLHLMQELLRRVAADREAPNFDFLTAALYYIDDFQERYHHPKEDEYLFKSLSAATAQFDDVISGLQAEHISGMHAMSQLHRYLVQYMGGAPSGLEKLWGRVTAYEKLIDEHMRCEEDLLERCGKAMAEEDWMRIAAAFEENDDPLFGDYPRKEFVRLYHRIMVLTPRALKQDLHAASHATA